MKKIFLTVLFFISSFLLFSESKNALLIANNDYKYFGRLETPVQEAIGLSEALSSIGFKVTVIH